MSTTASSADWTDGLVDQVKAKLLEELRSLDRSRFRNLKETAAYFGVSERQVRYWREQGCPARKNGVMMFNVEELEEWLDASEVM